MTKGFYCVTKFFLCNTVQQWEYKYTLNGIESFILIIGGNIVKNNIEKKESTYGVSIIICTHVSHYMDNIFNNYQRQAYPVKELILILNSNNLNRDAWEKKAREYANVRIFSLDESIKVGSCMNYAISQAKYDFIANFDHDDYYGSQYLFDYLEAAQVTDAGLFGKKTHYVYIEEEHIIALMHPGFENCYVDYVDGNSVFARKSIFDVVKYIDNDTSDCQLSWDCQSKGIKIFSVNRFYFAYIRKNNINNHTWKIENDELLSQFCWVIGEVEDYVELVNAEDFKES